MNDEQLRSFTLVYETRSYAQAARRSSMSRQGVALAMHALERELGVTLFLVDEGAHVLVPTAFADKLVAFARTHASNLRLLGESFARISGNPERTIRLGCCLGTLGMMGSDFVAGFETRHPHVHIRSYECSDIACDDGLHDETFDLALVATPYCKDFDVREIDRIERMFWVPASDPLAKKASLSAVDLAGRRIAIPGRGFKCYDWLQELARHAHVTLGDVYQMSEIFQLYEFATSGRGLGFTVSNLARLDLFSGEDSGVVAVPVDGASEGFGIARLASRALGDAERLFWDWCVSYRPRLRSA